jgi:uncharacterized protein
MNARSVLFVLISGMLFGFGLALSTMVKPESVLNFLRFIDFGLLLVLGGAAGVTMLAYQLAPKLMRKPWFAEQFGTHPSAMNAHTIGGAALFGIGWGLSGVCPGPALAGLGTGNWPLLVSVVALFAGAYVHGRWFGKT